MFTFLRRGFFLVALSFAMAVSAAIPERWFADKASLEPGVTKAEIYHALPKRHHPIAELPAVLAEAALAASPSDLSALALAVV